MIEMIENVFVMTKHIKEDEKWLMDDLENEARCVFEKLLTGRHKFKSLREYQGW